MPRIFPAAFAILVLALGETFASTAPLPPIAVTAVYVAAIPIAALLLALGTVWRAHRKLGTRDVLAGARVLIRAGRVIPFASGSLLLLAMLVGRWYDTLAAELSPLIPVLPRLIAVIPYGLGLVGAAKILSRCEYRIFGTREISASLSDPRKALMMLVPYFLVTGLLDLGWFFPEAEETLHTDPLVALLALIGFLLALMLLAPFVVRFAWPCASLAGGGLRELLEGITDASKTPCRDIKVWDTGGADVVNACVTGLVGPLRYVFFTDGLLRRLDSPGLVAVFAHELGHIRRHHLWLFFVWLLSGLLGFLALETAVAPLDWTVELAAYAGLLLVGSAGFIALSRHLECEADLYGSSLTDPTVYARTLERVGSFGISLEKNRFWRRHPSIARRIEVVLAGRDPEFVRRFRRRSRWVLGLIAAAGVLAAVGYTWSYREQRDRPTHLRQIAQAGYLLDKYDERCFRNGRPGERERTMLKRAATLLESAERTLADEGAPEEDRRPITEQLEEIHRVLGERSRRIEPGDPLSP